MKQSSERFGTINTAKGEDDGAVFRNFVRESRRHTDRRGLATDAIEEMLEKGKVSLFEFSKNICHSKPHSTVHSLLLQGV